MILAYDHAKTGTHLNPFTLSFDNEKHEKAFVQEFDEHALITVKFGIVLAFVLFFLYAILDRYVFPDAADRLFQLRMVEGVFLMVLFFLLSVKKEFVIRKLHVLSFILTLFTGLILLKISAFEPENSIVYILYDAGFVLYITASFTVFGNRFISALVTVSIVTIGIGAILYGQLAFMPLLFLLALFFSTILLSGFSAYISECNQRILFLEQIYAKKMEDKLQEYVRKLEKLSVTDKLTRLYNRVKLEKELKRVMSEFQRYKTPCSLIMIDIDHFKSVNDRFGHLEGDHVLVKIARILQEKTRTTDIVGRWGGEEFLIIAPNIGLKQAEILSEKLRKAVENENFGKVDRRTVSIGVSAFEEDMTIDDTIESADKALYKAKNSGRNRVVAA